MVNLRMNKEDFGWILQSALLYFDGISYENLIKLGAKPQLAKIGIKLCEFLSKKQLKKEENQPKIDENHLKNSKNSEKTPTFPMENKEKKYKDYGEVDFEDHEIEQTEERYDKTNKELDNPLNE